MTTAVAYRLRTGLSYKKIMQYEHINEAREISEIVNLFYDQISIKRFPTRFYNLSFYTYIEARAPKILLCEKYLNDIKKV